MKSLWSWAGSMRSFIGPVWCEGGVADWDWTTVSAEGK